MKPFLEKERELPIAYDVDVVVAGGGAAGVAAAVGAARQGYQVLLIEKYGFCGGMATAGMSGTICGLFTSTRTGTPEQLVNGFAGEFYTYLRSRGGVSDPFPFGQTALVVHDPHVWKEVADDLIAAANVRVLYHTYCVGVIADGTHIDGIIIENKSGRNAVKAKRFIDCTGDGDLSVWAGAPFVYGKNGAVQYPTMVFRMNGVDVRKALSHDKHRLEALIGKAEADGYTLPRKHIYLFPSPRPDEVMCNVTRISKNNGDPIDATKAEDLTMAEMNGRRQVREYVRFLTGYVPGFEGAMLNDVAAQVGIRQSRTIIGRAVLTNQDVFQARKSDQSVAKCAWCIEAHGEDGIYMFYLDDDYYDIPYGALLPRNVDNLLTAGRIISAEHEALASARVTAQCFLTGYAAGTASALSIRDRTAPDGIDRNELTDMIDYCKPI